MAVTGTIRGQGQLVGFPWGRRQIDLAWDFTAGVALDATVSLTTSPTTLTFGFGATLMILQPPSQNATAWLYSTDGTVFQPAHPTLPLLLTSDGNGGTIHVKTASGSFTLSHVQL